jgi:hypothetical protein
VKSRDYGNISYYKTIFFYYIAKFPFFKTDVTTMTSEKFVYCDVKPTTIDGMYFETARTLY